jgi:hypothetical protein
MPYLVRWQTALHKAPSGTVVTDAGEWRYLTYKDGYRQGTYEWSLEEAKAFRTRQSAEAAASSITRDAMTGHGVCAWYDVPDRKTPIVEVVEVTARTKTVVIGYDLKI